MLPEHDPDPQRYGIQAKKYHKYDGESNDKLQATILLSLELFANF